MNPVTTIEHSGRTAPAAPPERYRLPAHRANMRLTLVTMLADEDHSVLLPTIGASRWLQRPKKAGVNAKG
jgi:hypothetical protein